ncbi:MAG: FeS-binding protein [Actinobacteria bacterium]|nr:FeS-binding protein [Actinomycetota bacterium]
MKRQLKLSFRGPKIKRPLIYEVGHKFKIITSIRQADVDTDGGWVILELEGEKAQIEQSIKWMEKEGVGVFPVAGDVVEG